MTTTTTTETGANTAEAAASGGMPQLDFSTFPNQIFWLLVSLIVLYMLLSRIALPRIGGTIQNRKNTITSDLAAAEELKTQAIAAEKAYHQALTDARGEATRIIAETKAAIQKDLDKATAKADAEIAAKAAESEKALAEIRDGAMDAVTEVAKATAKEIVAALGGKTDARAITAAVNAALKG